MGLYLLFVPWTSNLFDTSCRSWFKPFEWSPNHLKRHSFSPLTVEATCSFRLTYLLSFLVTLHICVCMHISNSCPTRPPTKPRCQCPAPYNWAGLAKLPSYKNDPSIEVAINDHSTPISCFHIARHLRILFIISDSTLHFLYPRYPN